MPAEITMTLFFAAWTLVDDGHMGPMGCERMAWFPTREEALAHARLLLDDCYEVVKSSLRVIEMVDHPLHMDAMPGPDTTCAYCNEYLYATMDA